MLAVAAAGGVFPSGKLVHISETKYSIASVIMTILLNLSCSCASLLSLGFIRRSKLQTSIFRVIKSFDTVGQA